MNSFVKFFHELMNPHCSHCEQLRGIELELERDRVRCNSCEQLSMQLADSQAMIKNLSEKITAKPVEQPPTVIADMKPIRRGPIPFSMIRQQLEAESRTKAAAMKEAAKPDDVAAIVAETELEQLVFNAGTIKEEISGIKQA